MFAGACSAASNPRPPELPVQVREAIQPGDTLRIAIEDDASLGSDVVVASDGSADLSYCGRIVFAGLDARKAEDAVAACVVDARLYTMRPWVGVRVLARRESVTLIVGRARTRRLLPCDPGLTVIRMLSRELVLEGRGAPSQIELHRRGGRYPIDVEAILRGDEPDLPIEPSDTLVIAETFALHPAGPSAGILPARADGQRAARISEESCGELVLEEAGLRAAGLGDRHPDLIAVRQRLVATCTDDNAGASFGDACKRAWQQREAAAADYGPAHPTMRALDAQLALCPPIVASRPAVPDCPALREEHDALVAAGKGPKHPLMVLNEAKLRACR